MFEYVVEGSKFGFDYQDLKNRYQGFLAMDDDVFMENLVDAAHFACMVCFVKNVPTYICLSDKGIVHELVHLMKEGTSTTDLGEIRQLFKDQLQLS